MRNLTTSLLLALSVPLITSCSQSSATPPGAPRIAISPDGIIINSVRLTRPVPFAQLKTLLGTPSRVKVNSPSEAAAKRQKFGFEPNDLYTYDKLGIVVYHKAGRANVESMSIDFRNEGLDFSPSANFSGALTIGGTGVNRNTSVADLQAISGMRIEISPIKKHSGLYGQHSMTFDFGRLSDDNELAGIGIELGPAQKTNRFGWTEEEIKAAGTMLAGTAQLHQVAAQLNISSKVLADCFIRKVANQLTKQQMQVPDTQAQGKIQAAMEACATQTPQR